MSDTRELTRLLGSKFVQRKDVKAFQRQDGAWFPERSPMTMANFDAHLAGTSTMGHYMLDLEGNCKLFAFDIDLVKHARTCIEPTCHGCPVTFSQFRENADGDVIEDGELSGIPREMYVADNPALPTLTMELRIIAEGLARKIADLDIPVAVATSGHKGLHVYGFTGSMPAEAARQVATGILEDYGCFEPFRGQIFWRHMHDFLTLDIEVFPKQNSLAGKDLGNLMKLPLGVHQVTKRRARFITLKSSLSRFVTMDPIRALEGDNPWD